MNRLSEFWDNLTGLARFLIIGVPVAGCLYGVHYGIQSGYIKSAPPVPVSVPKSAELPALPQAAPPAAVPVRVPQAAVIPDLPNGIVPVRHHSFSVALLVRRDCVGDAGRSRLCANVAHGGVASGLGGHRSR